MRSTVGMCECGHPDDAHVDDYLATEQYVIWRCTVDGCDCDRSYLDAL